MNSKQLGEIEEKIAQARLCEARAAQHVAQARLKLVAIAEDLLPQAAALARKGRPRLLAVLTKVVSEKNVKSQAETLAALSRSR